MHQPVTQSAFPTLLSRADTSFEEFPHTLWHITFGFSQLTLQHLCTYTAWRSRERYCTRKRKWIFQKVLWSLYPKQEATQWRFWHSMTHESRKQGSGMNKSYTHMCGKDQAVEKPESGVELCSGKKSKAPSCVSIMTILMIFGSNLVIINHVLFWPPKWRSLGKSWFRGRLTKWTNV